MTFNKEARERYLAFAIGPEVLWPGNFGDLAASVTRMATFSPKGRIDLACAKDEIARLKRLSELIKLTTLNFATEVCCFSANIHS